MFIGITHTQITPPKQVRFAECRYHGVLDPSKPFNELYHSFLYEKYRADWAGYSEGSHNLFQVFEGMARNRQYICLTINSRTGKPGSFKIASPGSYVAAARCAVRAMKEFGLSGFIAVFSEPGYRFGLNRDNVRSWLDPVYETVKMLNPKLQVGAPGEEWVHPNAEGIYDAVIKSQKIDILTVHTLTDSNQRLVHYKKIWPGPIAVVETGSMQDDYRTLAGAQKIEEIVKYVYKHRDKVVCCGIVYGESNNPEKASWTLRLWDRDYTKILNTTPAWNKLVQMVEQYSNNLPEMQPETGEEMKLEILKVGSRGVKVKYVQESLQDLGYKVGPIDGIFGNLTEAGVREYQQEHDLKVDGVVGLQTIESLLTNDPNNLIFFALLQARWAFGHR